MSFKTPIVVDRRVYDKKGKWQDPRQDIYQNVFYFVKEPLSLVATYVNGIEELKETITITVFGGKPIAKEDNITLGNGAVYKVVQITPNYITHNVLVADLLKPRIESMDLVLE